MKLIGRIGQEVVLEASAQSRFARPVVTAFSPTDLPGMDADKALELGVLAVWAREASRSVDLEWLGDYELNPD